VPLTEVQLKVCCIASVAEAELAPHPVFLAGGVRADNVAMAMREVQPSGVDLCSGVRTGGRLDAGKLSTFVKALRGALPA